MTVFYSGAAELATLTNVFRVNGTATDPTTVTLVVTSPGGTATTYTYSLGEITKTATGTYTKDVPCAEAGRWRAVWTGTGAASDVQRVDWEVESSTAETYASLARLKKHLGNITEETRDELLVGALMGASRAIDRTTGRHAGGFSLAGTASARTFRPHGRVVNDCDGQRLLVDEIGSSGSLAVEVGTAGGTYTALSASAYETGPENALTIGEPVSWLLMLNSWWAVSPTTRIRVTARWGWPAVPDQIVQATLMLAARYFNRKNSPDGLIVGPQDWGSIRITRSDPDVAALIGPYMLPGFGA